MNFGIESCSQKGEGHRLLDDLATDGTGDVHTSVVAMISPLFRAFLITDVLGVRPRTSVVTLKANLVTPRV